MLFAAESLLKLVVLSGEKKKIEEKKKKANEVELREYSVYLLSMEDHISFDVCHFTCNHDNHFIIYRYHLLLFLVHCLFFLHHWPLSVQKNHSLPSL